MLLVHFHLISDANPSVYVRANRVGLFFFSSDANVSTAQKRSTKASTLFSKHDFFALIFLLAFSHRSPYMPNKFIYHMKLKLCALVPIETKKKRNTDDGVSNYVLNDARYKRSLEVANGFLGANQTR